MSSLSQHVSTMQNHFTKKNRALTVAFIGLTLFVGLPVIFFIIMAIQGFIASSGNDTPFDVTVSSITRSEAVIRWETDKKTNGTVEYGTSPTGQSSFAPEVRADRSHEVTLTLLAPSSAYYFQITINGKTYDNEGVPWTFTTKTKDGNDVIEAIKGVSTRVARDLEDATNEAKLVREVCTGSTCQEIQQKLGKGCTSTDYIRCLGGQLPTSVTPIAETPVAYPTATSIPSPTSVLIDSNACKLKELYTLNNNCAVWEWASIAVSPDFCTAAFDRYILQCRDKRFEESIGSSDYSATYVINNSATISKTLPITPVPGKTIYCRLRAVDADGTDEGDAHATPWLQAEKKCE